MVKLRRFSKLFPLTKLFAGENISFNFYIWAIILTTIGLSSILLINYRLLLSKTRVAAYAKCRNDMRLATSDFNVFMLKAHTVLTKVSHRVDKMIAAGTPPGKIKASLKEMDADFHNTYNTHFISIYGYIANTFIDTSTWNIPETYDPKKRVWYYETINSSDKIVLVSPYLDMATGETVFTMASKLSDGVSVVAMDHFFKDIVKFNSRCTDGLQRDFYLLDKFGSIISINNSGKDIDNTNRLPDEVKDILEIIKHNPGKPYEVNIDGVSNMVVFDQLIDGWSSVSVFNEEILKTRAYRELYNHIFITIGITSLVWLFLSFSFYFLQKSRERATNAEKSKSLFFASVSHEIRTPLNSIIGFSELLEKGGISHAETIEYINDIKNSGKMLMQLVNDILDMSKLDSGKIDTITSFQISTTS